MKVRKTGLFCLAVCLMLGLTGCKETGKEQSVSYVEGLDELGEIQVISREEGSGTRSAFARLVDFASNSEEQAQPDLTREDAQIAENTEEVIQAVENGRAAVGYVSMGALTDGRKVKILSVNGVEADAENGKYPLSRSFFLAYSGKLSDLEQDFLTYVHGAGQKIVAESFMPVAKSSTFLSNQAEGTITIKGSTSVAPLMEELAAAYMELNKNADILVEATDSADGLNRAMSGECDFGMSSVDLKEYEKELLDYEVIAEDKIAVIVNEDNPLDNITMDALKGIFTGEIKQWEELNELR